MDSILKFAGDYQETYRNFFAKEFVELFVDTFKKVFYSFSIYFVVVTLDRVSMERVNSAFVINNVFSADSTWTR